MKTNIEALKALFDFEGWLLIDNGDFTYNIYCEPNPQPEDLVAEKVCLARCHYEYLLIAGMLTDEEYLNLVDSLDQLCTYRAIYIMIAL